MMSPNISGQILNFHSTGKIRVLAINAKERIKAAPDIPTAIEQGVPDMVGQLFLGIYARTGTPKPSWSASRTPPKRSWPTKPSRRPCSTSGFDAVSYFGAEQGRRYMAEEVARWKPVVDAIGLKVR